MADPAAAAAAEQPALPPINVSAGGRDSSSPVSTPFSHPRSPWLLGLAAVIFDVDKGQTLQDVWPPDCLSEAEQAAVAFHSFPDSLSMELYSRSAVKDSSFTFRIKREPQPATNSSSTNSSSTAGAGGYAPAAFLYGYVFCRQRQDESLRRGGEQASVVVLSLAPLGSALLPLSQAAGHAFFSEGPIALAAVYNQVLMWQPPLPGGSMCLPLAAGGGVINARVPHFCLLPPPQPEVDAGLAASLTRRASRTISLRAGYSPRAPASSSISISRQGSEAAEQQQQQGGAQAAASAAADGDGSKGAQQQEGGEQAGSSLARSGSHGSSQELAAVGARPNSASRLSRPDLASGGSTNNTNSSQTTTSKPGSATAAAAAAQEAPASGLVPPGAYQDWLAQQLGQHWRDETPFPEVEPALALAPLLKELWTLWQLVVTSQPLMVVGLTPADTSAATAALAALVAPLPVAADVRPYFTIHDPDFIALAAGRLPVRRRYREPRRPQQQQQQQPAGSSVAQADPAAAAGDEQQQQQQQVQDGSAPAAPPTAPPSKEQQARAAAAAAAAAALAGDLPVVLGVTNQHFVKILPAWPNVVAVSRKEPAAAAAAAAGGGPAGGGPSGSGGSTGVSRSSSPGARTASFVSEGGAGAAAGAAALAQQAGASPGGGGSGSTSSPVPPPAAGGRFGSGLLSSTAAAAVRALQRRHQGPQHLLSHFAPHLWTSRAHAQFIRPDPALLSKARAAIEPAVGACASPAAAAVAAALAGGGGSNSGSSSSSSSAATAAARLRRHFAELSAALLAVFDPYFTPGPSGKVPAWRPEAFLASLNPATLPPALAARLWGNAGAAARGLLGEFIDSPNFAFWFAQRRAAVAHLIEEDAGSEDDEDDDGFARVGAADGDLSDAGVASGSGDDDGDEVELVQQLLSAEGALTQWQQQHASGDDTSPPSSSDDKQEQLRALQLRFGAAFARLPRDLAVAMVATPARQELLAAAAEALLDSSSSDSSRRGPDAPAAAAASGQQQQQQQQASASAVGERLQLLLAELLQTAADRA